MVCLHPANRGVTIDSDYPTNLVEQLHRLRFHFLPQDPSSGQTPTTSRPPSPHLASIVEGLRAK
jgi:hypothetical protein